MMKKMWSVELESSYYTDDIFNGSFEECVEYCKDHNYEIGTEARIAEILVDEDGCVVETLNIIEEI